MGVSTECMDLLKRLLAQDPEARITAVQAICHRWFSCVVDCSAEAVTVSKQTYSLIRNGSGEAAQLQPGVDEGGLMGGGLSPGGEFGSLASVSFDIPYFGE